MAFTAKTDWKDGDKLAAVDVNRIEAGIAAKAAKGDKGDPGEAYTLPAAKTNALGGVKQAAAVPDAAAAPTKEEFNALLASLRAAGILANA